jgi:hypothetical protein
LLLIAYNRTLQMEEFFAKYPEAGAGTKSRKNALEVVQNNIRWMERSVDDILPWLAKQPFEA